MYLQRPNDTYINAFAFLLPGGNDYYFFIICFNTGYMALKYAFIILKLCVEHKCKTYNDCRGNHKPDCNNQIK